ncbi:uncharacterized protein [Primulina huaijiensis]|uniref:uncharacterized protein isoform X2 n=1 Tax=Primulina huaijiensis TaxID=1492673 RepID=UPI003CC78DE6
MVALFEVLFRRSHGKDIIVACKKNMKKNLREWAFQNCTEMMLKFQTAERLAGRRINFFYRREFGACRVYLTEREISSRRVTRTGKKMAKVHIINTLREAIGTGIRINRLEIMVVILGRLLEPQKELHYHITTRYLALTEFAETKFKEVMVSYEAIKTQRKNNGQ